MSQEICQPKQTASCGRDDEGRRETAEAPAPFNHPHGEGRDPQTLDLLASQGESTEPPVSSVVGA